jgi:hypothetical protein
MSQAMLERYSQSRKRHEAPGGRMVEKYMVRNEDSSIWPPAW